MSNDDKSTEKTVNVKALRCPHCGAPLKSRYLTNCPNCGVEIVIQEGTVVFPEEDVLDAGVFDPENVWLLTDIVAKANFRFEGKLEELEQDIRFNVMRGKPWQKEDIEFIREIKRLLDAKIIKKTTSFWFSSPFPTVFRALKDDEMTVAGKKYAFKGGDEIVWQCQMGRELHHLVGPVLIGKFTPKRMAMFCKEMENVAKGSGRILLKT